MFSVLDCDVIRTLLCSYGVVCSMHASDGFWYEVSWEHFDLFFDG